MNQPTMQLSVRTLLVMVNVVEVVALISGTPVQVPTLDSSWMNGIVLESIGTFGVTTLTPDESTTVPAVPMTTRSLLSTPRSVAPVELATLSVELAAIA